jgi:hypothetical protein
VNLLCVFWICAQASLGYTFAAPPPDGTWWESGQPHEFHMKSKAWEVGIGGRVNSWSRWSLEYADLGVQNVSSTACAAAEPACTSGKQPMSHWYAHQHPRGVWTAWEPHLWGPLSAKLGGGLLRPVESTVDIPDWIGCLKVCGAQPISVDSGSRWHPSYIAGLILTKGPFDLVIANRFLYIPNKTLVHNGATVHEYTNLSKSAWTFTMRWRL